MLSRARLLCFTEYKRKSGDSACGVQVRRDDSSHLPVNILVTEREIKFIQHEG